MIRYYRPEPITSERAARLSEAAAVMGRPLTGVRYRFPAGTPWPQGYARGRMDEVDLAVALDFADGSALVVSWAMQRFTEGIDVEAGRSAGFAVVADRESEFAAADSGPWAGLRGQALSGLAVAWHKCSEFAPASAWAVRLSFAAGEPVIIALGQLRDGVADYQPDGLLVFFVAAEADLYREAHESQGGETSAPWQPVTRQDGQ